MKDPIEDALAQLKPGELPPELMARLTAARAQLATEEEPSLGFWRRWLIPIAAGSCAAVVALAWLRREEPVEAKAPVLASQDLPYERQEILMGAREMGLVVAPNQRPYRVVELEWLEQETVRQSERGPGVLVETTRREVVPVALEIF